MIADPTQFSIKPGSNFHDYILEERPNQDRFHYVIEYRAENFMQTFQKIVESKPILRIPYDVSGDNDNSALVNWPETIPTQFLIKHGEWQQNQFNSDLDIWKEKPKNIIAETTSCTKSFVSSIHHLPKQGTIVHISCVFDCNLPALDDASGDEEESQQPQI